MFRFLKAMILVFAILALSAPAKASDAQPVIARIDNVVKVFMHEVGSYSVLQKNGDEYMAVRVINWADQKAREKGVSTFFDSTNVSEHLAQSKTGYTYVELYKVNNITARAVIYLNSLDALGGGEYRCGKNCAGTTQVIK